MNDTAVTRQVTLSEACRLLGISHRTAERRLTDGSLKAIKQGRRWIVEVPAALEGATLLPVETPESLARQVGDLARQNAELTERDTALARQVAELAARCEVLTAQLDAVSAERDRLWQLSVMLTTKVPALPAPTPTAPTSATSRRWRWPWQRGPG